MALDDIQPFLDRDCDAVVHCRACGREHAVRGLLTTGSRGGDLLMAGCTYSPEDFVSITCEADLQQGDGTLARTLPYLGIAAALVSWLHVIRR